jgi:hypothetical protein
MGWFLMFTLLIFFYVECNHDEICMIDSVITSQDLISILSFFYVVSLQQGQDGLWTCNSLTYLLFFIIITRGELVRLDDIEKVYKKRRHDKDSRLTTVLVNRIIPEYLSSSFFIWILDYVCKPNSNECGERLTICSVCQSKTILLSM